MEGVSGHEFDVVCILAKTRWFVFWEQGVGGGGIMGR